MIWHFAWAVLGVVVLGLILWAAISLIAIVYMTKRISKEIEDEIASLKDREKITKKLSPGEALSEKIRHGDINLNNRKDIEELKQTPWFKALKDGKL